MTRCFLACVLLWLSTAAEALSAPCAPLTFEDGDYVVCRFDPAAANITLHNLDESGQPIATFDALAERLEAEGKSLVFAMNAGMFQEDLTPVGLHIENGKRLKSLNTRSARNANFYLKPNGVFYVSRGEAFVVETGAYRASGVKPDLATQSGPMLVIGGKIHPRFTAGSRNLNRRNGVGVAESGEVVFAISEGAVNFHDFARLFRDALSCRNALYLDGAISRMFSRDLGRDEPGVDLGPIVAVTE